MITMKKFKKKTLFKKQMKTIENFKTEINLLNQKF